MLSFEGDQKVQRYASRLQAMDAIAASMPAPEKKKAAPKKDKPKPKSSGLNYKERKALETLPAEIEALEAQREALGEKLADPQTYQGPPKEAVALTQEFNALEQTIAERYAQWEDLEARSEG